MVAGLRASAQPRHLADLTPASAPSSMPHEPSSLLPSPAAAEALPPSFPLKQHASAVLAAAGVDMRGQGGATAPAAEPQDGEAGSGGSGGGGPAPALAAGAGLGPVHHGNGAGQPQQQHPTSAAAAAPNPGGALPAVGPPPSPGAAAAAELEAILARLMQIDKEGWFRHPVSELVAPKYYKIIKQPMCFEVMRNKIHGRQYLTWQEMARDFELICSNALKYNQKRSHVYKQALTLSRVGKKVLAEVEQHGRRAMAALVAAGAAEAAPVSLQLTPADSQAVPSSMFRAGGAPAGAAPLRSQSTADTATTEGADSEPIAVEAAPWPAEDEADPAGYSSYEATDMDEDEVEEAAARQQAAALLDAAARDAVLAQPWAWLAGDSAAAPDAAQQQQQQRAGQQQQEARPQQGAQQPAAPAVAAEAGHSREWKAARRGVEWRVRWLEHRLAELHHQRLRYEQQLEAEAEREAARQQAAQQPAGEQQQQPQGAAAEAAENAAGQPAAAAAAAEQPPAQQEPEVKAEDGAALPATAEPSAAAQAPAVAGPRLWQHRPHRELAECQLPGLLQHPFIAAHSVLGARQQAAAGGGTTAAGGGAQLPAAMDSEDFPAEVHAALDLLDHKLSSLRRQLVAMQRPAAQAALHRVQSVRVPGYRGGGGGGARRGGGWTPRSGGATPRGTPRSGSLYRDSSLGKRRRVPEYDVGEVITPLGAPKFVERAQVKTIDTPRVRPLPNTEVKKRQAALEAYASQRKEGKEESEALAAIDLLCPGESSSEEDTSDEAYLRRHHKMEAEERARYEAVLAPPAGVAVKKNKQQPKVSKERGKQLGAARHVSRTLSAPAFVGNGGTPMAAAGAAPSPRRASPASSMLPGAASAPAGSLAAVSAPAPGSTAPSPAKAGAAAVPAAPSPAAAPPAAPAAAADAAASKQPAGAPAAAAPAAAPQQQAQQQQAQPGGQPSASGASGKDASSDAAAAAAVTAAPPASLPSLAAPNGLPMGLMLPPLNPAQMAAQSMAAQMAQAHMAAMAAVVGPPGGKQGGSGGGSAGAAGASGLLGPPFGLTPAMAAAMAAAMPPLGGLPPGLQGILPNGGASAPANGGGGGRGSGRRGRPPGRGRPRR